MSSTKFLAVFAAIPITVLAQETLEMEWSVCAITKSGDQHTTQIRFAQEGDKQEHCAEFKKQISSECSDKPLVDCALEDDEDGESTDEHWWSFSTDTSCGVEQVETAIEATTGQVIECYLDDLDTNANARAGEGDMPEVEAYICEVQEYEGQYYTSVKLAQDVDREEHCNEFRHQIQGECSGKPFGVNCVLENNYDIGEGEHSWAFVTDPHCGTDQVETAIKATTDTDVDCLFIGESANGTRASAKSRDDNMEREVVDFRDLERRIDDAFPEPDEGTSFCERQEFSDVFITTIFANEEGDVDEFCKEFTGHIQGECSGNPFSVDCPTEGRGDLKNWVFETDLNCGTEQVQRAIQATTGEENPECEVIPHDS